MRLSVVPVVFVLLLSPTNASAAVTPPPTTISNEARSYLRSALDLFKQMHINRDNVSWADVEARAFQRARNASTSRDTYPAIQGVISALGERHTFLIEPQTPSSQASASSPGEPATAPIAPTYPVPTGSMLAGRYGLIQLPGYGGSSDEGVPYTRALANALQSLEARGACGWIVDLRNNFGGNMWPMLNGLYELLGSSPYGYFTTYGQGGRDPWMLLEGYVGYSGMPPPPEIVPLTLRRPSAPVAVLIDDTTWSSAELIAIAFRHVPNVRFIGQPSGGYVTVNNPQRLSDGAVILMTVGWSHDRSGEKIAGPLHPEVLAEKGQPTVDAAVNWLRQQRACIRQG